MASPGDIYKDSKKIIGDPASGHWWVLLYVDNDDVLYITATSQIEPFIYQNTLTGLQRPMR